MPVTPKELTRQKHLRLGIFGWSGIGKTQLLGTHEGSTLLIRPPQEHTDAIVNPVGKVQEMVVDSWAAMYEAADYLGHDGDEWDWVWVDGWSSLQDTLLFDVFKDAIARKPERRKFGPDKQEYGINMGRISEWMRDVIALDTFNFGWTAWPFQGSIMNDEREEVELLLPWVQGNGMPLKLCGMMQSVYYYQMVKQKDKDVRVLRSNLTENYFANDRFNAFTNGRLVNPTMPKILEAIEVARPKPARKKKTASKTARRRTRRTTS